MSTTTVHTPTLETERLILRAPRPADLPFYTAFKASERSRFTGGPIDAARAAANFSANAGQWFLRGYGLFIATSKADPDTLIGGFGVFHPPLQDEPEFGWSLYDSAYEGRGFVVEAMRRIIPWAWPVMAVDTAQSHIDAGNKGSVGVAARLGATLDTAQTDIENAPGGMFHSEDSTGPHVNIWRHRKGALA